MSEQETLKGVGVEVAAEEARDATKQGEESGDGADAQSEGGLRKRVRQRKKHIYESIQRQMEFYFSDANLAKDRYLGELTGAGQAAEGTREVPLDVFLRFNKIRSITDDVKDIAKAVKDSKLLLCSEDDTKVRRKMRLEPYDADQRTVYVESIPAVASRDWLHNIFEDYGSVAYISLPTYKGSQKIKGYAFIEFTKPEGAQKCLNAFTKMGCKMPTCMPPEELSTIKLFAVEKPPDEEPSSKAPKVEETEMSTKKSKLEEAETPAEKPKVDKTESAADAPNVLETQSAVDEPKVRETKAAEPKEKIPESRRKAKKREFRNERVDEPPKKKQKHHRDKKPRKSLNNKSVEEPNVSSEDTSAVEGMEAKDEASSQADAAKVSDKAIEKKKKNRKRTTKDRNKSKKNAQKNEVPKGALWGLQVLAKAEWKALRNKYLNLQRKRIKDLKTSLWAKGTRPVPEQRQAADATVKAVEDKRVERTVGVFVRVSLPEPCLDVRLTKRAVRSNVRVQHVDVREGQTDMVVRFDAPDAAKQYCESGVYASARVLNEEECWEQWERAAEARGAGKGARRRAAPPERAPAAETPPAVAVMPATHVRFDE